MVGRSPPFISHNFDFLPKLSTSQKSAQMFTMTMAKFLRPAVATSTTTQNHDMKSDTLTEEQKQKILLQNRRTLESLLESVMVVLLEQSPETLRFIRTNMELHIDVPDDNFEMLHITCKLMTLDFLDSRVALRRKCRRMNANLSGVVLRINKRNQIELFYTTPMKSLTFIVFETVLKLLQDIAMECKFDLLQVRDGSRWFAMV
jgi:hypothetical protein